MYGNRIREARKKKGMTLKQVADATGYTIGHISQIERNLKSPSLSALRKIAACLECSEVWLIMGGSDDAPLAQADGEGGSRESFLIRKENRIPMKIPEIDVSYSILHPLPPPGRKGSEDHRSHGPCTAGPLGHRAHDLPQHIR